MSTNLESVRILFVTAADSSIGFGHLSRCLALAKHASSCKAHVNFLLFGSVPASQKVVQAGYGCSLVDIGRLKAQSCEWLDIKELHYDVVITDLLFPTFSENCNDPSALFSSLNRLGRLSVALDVLGDYSIAKKFPHLRVDLVVIPYVMTHSASSDSNWRLLEGARYALLPPEFSQLTARDHVVHGRRILVCCGGSDPKGYTLDVLQSIECLKSTLEVKVVIGPLFNADLKSRVNAWIHASRHDIQLVNSPKSMLELMQWCDLAISASGLTKYELAASGTPALVFSIDAFHYELNQPFAAMGSSIDLGVGISHDLLINETTRLLNDCALRKKLAETGMKCVDGMGSHRFFTEIEKELSC